MVGIVVYIQSYVEEKLIDDIDTVQKAANLKATEAINQIKTVKLYRQEDQSIKNYNAEVKKSLKLDKRLAFTQGILSSGVSFSFCLCIVVGMWYGGMYINTYHTNIIDL